MCEMCEKKYVCVYDFCAADLVTQALSIAWRNIRHRTMLLHVVTAMECLVCGICDKSATQSHSWKLTKTVVRVLMGTHWLFVGVDG